jgi:hypothetical protein
VRCCAETSRQVVTLARLAGVSSRIFGSPQHDEILERNMAEWNHAHLPVFQDYDSGNEAAATPARAPPRPSSPIASRSLLPSSASPYLSDVPDGVTSADLARFAPSFSRDNTRLQFMRIASHGLKM